MNCPFCGTANPDHGVFCVQCGKRLKGNNPDSMEHFVETDSSLKKLPPTIAEDTRYTNSSDDGSSIENTETNAVIVPQETDDQEDITVSSINAVSLPLATPQEESPSVEVLPEKEDLSSRTNEELPQPTESLTVEESLPPVEEMSTLVASGPAIETEPTLQQNAVESQNTIAPEDPLMATPSADATTPQIYVEYGNSPINAFYPQYPSYSGNTAESPYYPGYPGTEGAYQPVPDYRPYPGYQQGQVPDTYQQGVSGTQYPPINAYPPIPASFADQTGNPTTPGYPYARGVMPPQSSRLKRIAQIVNPLPRWILVLCIVAVLFILGILQATGSDWADGAIHAAVGAIIIAILLLLFAGLRTMLGMANATNTKRRTQYIGSALGIMLLFVYSGLNLIGQTPLHILQAHYVEGQQHWQQALNEYELGGETAPSSTNLARVYDEWGEALSQSEQYTNAISKFDITLNDYTTPDEIARAQKDEINAYFSLGKQVAQNSNYTSATKEFDTALGLSFCSTACQKLITPSDATAYFNLALSQLNAQQYNDAVNNFKTVQSRFVNYPEAKKAHGYTATALLGKGKQDKANVCTSAIPTYQDLATNYADTPEGKEAANALSQTQPVMGHFTSPLPTDAVPAAVLTTTPINGTMSNDQLSSIIDNSPIITPINNDGTFKFQPQKQGTYDLAWVNITSDGSIYSIFYYVKTDPAEPSYYVANVGPLCPFDFGDISEPVAHS